jgi:hypothetical protein
MSQAASEHFSPFNSITFRELHRYYESNLFFVDAKFMKHEHISLLISDEIRPKLQVSAPKIFCEKRRETRCASISFAAASADGMAER